MRSAVSLGLPGFSSGCQAWEAELQGPGGGGCVVGVASEPVPRRGMLALEPLTGFWALRIAGSECQALTKAGTREDLSVCPRKVGVHVSHECGEVVFYDATTSNHIYTFQASFPGQVFPFFRLVSRHTDHLESLELFLCLSLRLLPVPSSLWDMLQLAGPAGPGPLDVVSPGDSVRSAPSPSIHFANEDYLCIILW